jgi:aerobic carbon-monoxide dehydrogenase large subunit
LGEQFLTGQEGLAIMAYKVLGTAVKRNEDFEMLRGDADFTADLHRPDMAYMVILRSTQAHARIRSIETGAARSMPGVIHVLTGADLQDKIKPLPCVWVPGGVESHFPSHPLGMPGAGDVLAHDRVRYIGDPVAVVVAETQHQAYEAVQMIHVDYHPLPVVVDAEEALKEGAPQLHDEVLHNLNAYIPYGDKEHTLKAIEEAEVVIRQNIRIPRTINNPIEPRAALSEYDPASGNFTLYATSQSPHNHRLLLAYAILGIPFNKIRLVSPKLGGSFGTKGYVYPDMPLAMYLARELRRPIKWVDTRQGLMRSTVQGRDQMMYATLAGTRDGKITALYMKGYANLGAYPSTIGPGVATAMVGRNISGSYDIPNTFCEIYAVFTNLVSLGAQRGSGRTEATYMLERMIDQFAVEIGMDPVQVRRKNLVQPEQMPFDNRLGWTYDSGDYPAALEKALEMIEYHKIPELKAEAAARGKRLGVGIGCFVAVSGVGPSSRMAKEGMLGGTWESSSVRVHPTGEVEVMIGSTPHGQSHETTFAQVVAEELGIGVGVIRVVHSDTDKVPFGQGSYGSRSFSVGGAAAQIASRKVKEKACRYAAHKFGVSLDDVIYEQGKVMLNSDKEKALTLQEISLALYYSWDLPPDMEPSLEATTFLDPPGFNFPYGCNAVLVELDENTGEVSILRYVLVADVGTIGNPMVLDGQMHGAVVHGIGEALLEEAQYSPDGQLLTDSFSNYALPRAVNTPNIEVAYLVHPTPHTTLGAKGAGEVGTVGAPAAIGNAICDALSDLHVHHLDMPLTSEKVWRAIADAKARQQITA